MGGSPTNQKINPHYHCAMILPDEDKHRFDAPPEPSHDWTWDEPEDIDDYLARTDEPEPE